MLTKRQLFEKVNQISGGISIINSSKEYQDGIRNTLSSEYGEIDPVALEAFVKVFCCYISKGLAKHKKISVKKKHDRFLADKVITLLEFQTGFVKVESKNIL